MNARLKRSASSTNTPTGRPKLKQTTGFCPVRLILTRYNRLFIEVITTIPSTHVPRTLGAKLIGPIDPKSDPKPYLDYAEQGLAQTQAEIIRVFSKISALGDVFSAEVNLSDFRKNFDKAVAALEAKDMKALRKLCPEPLSE
ncbi:hypothetical protein KKE92_01935 [Candidatus Micrarchaeota archaeon]|nr:hypothetical protein [Candidatus Micrarchaeota archaeon]MBU1681723.1 hypothetical protein [Candidatus Micrarchaeota archaeon]